MLSLIIQIIPYSICCKDNLYIDIVSKVHVRRIHANQGPKGVYDSWTNETKSGIPVQQIPRFLALCDHDNHLHTFKV